MNLRDLILSAPDLKREAVEVPEWVTPEGKPVTVHVSEMWAQSRSDWHEHGFDDEGNVKPGFRSRLLTLTVVDETGAPIFTADDIDALEKKSAEAIGRLFLVARRLNGLGGEAVDDAEKN